MKAIDFVNVIESLYELKAEIMFGPTDNEHDLKEEKHSTKQKLLEMAKTLDTVVRQCGEGKEEDPEVLSAYKGNQNKVQEMLAWVKAQRKDLDNEVAPVKDLPEYRLECQAADLKVFETWRMAIATWSNRRVLHEGRDIDFDTAADQKNLTITATGNIEQARQVFDAKGIIYKETALNVPVLEKTAPEVSKTPSSATPSPSTST